MNGGNGQPDVRVGDRIRLRAMPDDPAPIPAGATGKVERINELSDGRDQIWVAWDPPNEKRTLMLIRNVDEWEVLRGD